jgi:hypothetical protein
MSAIKEFFHDDIERDMRKDTTRRYLVILALILIAAIGCIILGFTMPL